MFCLRINKSSKFGEKSFNSERVNKKCFCRFLTFGSYSMCFESFIKKIQVLGPLGVEGVELGATELLKMQNFVYA